MNVARQISKFTASSHILKTLASKKLKYYTCFNMKEKFLSFKGFSFLIWEDRSLVTGPVFSLRELRFLKKQIFIFNILVKPLDFVVKHYINITRNENCFLRMTIFEKIFMFFFCNKNFKRIVFAKARLL